MCKLTTAIEVVKSQKRKTLTREETLMLFEQVSADTKGLSDRMTNVEKRLSDVESKIDRLLVLADRPTIGKTLSSVFSNKLFVYIIVTLLTAAFGVGAGTVGVDLLK